VYDDGAWSDSLMTLWTTGESYKQIGHASARAEKDIHAAIRDLDAISLQVHQLTRHLVFPRKRNFAYDACVEARYLESTEQEYAHVARRDQRRQKLECLLGVQSGPVPCDQFEGRPQEIICCLDQRAQVDPKERQEYVARFGVRLVCAFAISVERKVGARSTEGQIGSIPLRFVVVAQSIHVQLQGAIVTSKLSKEYRSCLKQVCAKKISSGRSVYILNCIPSLGSMLSKRSTRNRVVLSINCSSFPYAVFRVSVGRKSMRGTAITSVSLYLHPLPSSHSPSS
jgi:hypothetical protein